ncbi:hypothetical protein BGZ93_007252 [Podila epicladia]|nr:hypothetical protein BGZ93_007252 [Podila epicladia]
MPIPFETLDNLKKPKVLIAGGGLGGLTLAILLHKAGIPFKVFERAREVKPLGSALALGAGIVPLFKQMGIYEEFLAIAKPYSEMCIFNDKLKPEYTMDCGWTATELSSYPPPPSLGYPHSIVARPDLYDLLWRHVPKECVFLEKKVVNFDDDAEGVLLRCADGTSYQGDILIGADGAYSAVRSHMYKMLKTKGLLPDVDDSPLPFHTVSLVGQTVALDPDEFPDLNMELCQFKTVLGSDNMCTWITFTTKKNTVCWMVIRYLSKSSSKSDDKFCNPDWGPEATEAMCNEVRAYKVPGKDGKVQTLGDYIDRTPKELIVKVKLEEKVFDTWYCNRTVLLGDACHKINPVGGTGALNAIHDAVTLANWLSTLRFPNISDLDRVFNEYYLERYPVAKKAFESSQLFTKNLGKGMMSSVVRAGLKRLPRWMWRRMIIKVVTARPQASFLPLVEEDTLLKAVHQPSLHKTAAIANNRLLLTKRIPVKSKLSLV